MKPFRPIYLFLLAITATAVWLRADEPPAPAAPPAPVAEAPAPAVPAIASEAPADDARRRTDKIVAEAEAALAKAQAEAAAALAKAQAEVQKAREQAQIATTKTDEPEPAEPAPEPKRTRKSRNPGGGDRVAVADDNHVEAGTIVPHDAIAVMGNLTVDGEVMHDAIAVMGDNTVNGQVHHNVIAIMGDIRLGPKAVVGGDLICPVGTIHRDPGAVVKGQVVVGSRHGNLDGEKISDWWNQTLKIGRPLAIGAHLGWLWVVTGFSIAFYALLGLVFPRRITACGDKLLQEPGLVILSAVLSVLALPVLFVLLCITIIGIPVALLVLPVTCLFVAMFGKAAIYGLIGRKLTGDRFHPAVAVVLGALLAILIYVIPFVGLLLSLLVWFLGFGCAVLLMFGRTKPVVTVPPVPPLAPAAFAAETSGPAAVASAFTASVEPPPIAPPIASAAAHAVAAMVVTADTTPRAGFWIRVAAAFLDFLMLVVPLGMLGAMNDGPGAFFLGLAAYHATMWKLKGTTIGGIICGLKVVRLDDRPLDWGVAIVRALSGFLSFFVAGFGFIWVAFDDEKQSWHDKIAGTTIVKVPKGVSLL